MTFSNRVFLTAALACAVISPAFSQSLGAGQAEGNGGYAVVTLAGKLTHSKNVSNFNHTGLGTYTIQFNGDVSNCSATATIARRGKDSLLPGFIVVGDPQGNKDTVTVATFDTVTLLAADYPFDLTVTC